MPTDFNPYSALAGGLLIGLAATLLYATLGRSANTGAMADHAIEHRSGRRWRLAFLLSMLAACGAWFALAPGAAPARTDFPIPWLVGAGLLVGFGSRLISSCTGGQGLFGMAQLSQTSFAPVATFLASAAATVLLLHQVLGGLS